MLIDPDKTRFLRPSSALYQLLVLQEIQKNGFVVPPRTSLREIANTIVIAQLASFVEAGWTEVRQEAGEQVHRITPAGALHLRLLAVDYVQEVIELYRESVESFRKRLAGFYLAGARRVAFYPIGETAEVVFRAIHDTGLTLVAAIDDDPARWHSDFHGLKIQGPETLAASAVDAVIVTTCAFQAEVSRSLESLHLPQLAVLTL